MAAPEKSLCSFPLNKFAKKIEKIRKNPALLWDDVAKFQSSEEHIGKCYISEEHKKSVSFEVLFYWFRLIDNKFSKVYIYMCVLYSSPIVEIYCFHNRHYSVILL